MALRFNLDTPPGRSLRIPNASMQSDWLQVFPVEKKMAGAAATFVSTTGNRDAPSESDLADLFDLSPTQQQIVLRLFEGQPRDEIGNHLQIARNTMKTHVSTHVNKARHLAPNGDDEFVLEGEGAQITAMMSPPPG